MENYKVGFIGYGNMAKAIAKSLHATGYADKIYASDVNRNAADGSVIMLESNADVINKSDFVFLSVKPQAAADALAGLDFAGKTVISIMAGTDLAALTGMCRGTDKIVRVMPNLCARVGKAVNAYCPSGLDDNEELVVERFLSAFGMPAKLEESYFDTITGLTGSSPAYTFRYAKALTECGVKHGLSFERSRDLTLYCIAACMDVLASADSLEDMQTTIDNVCSKGGTTIEGIYKLDEGHFDEVVISAVDAAIRRSAELGRK